MLLPIVFSNHCNLDCAYCCITNKNTSPILSLEKAFEFVDKMAATYGEENLEIEFFGGEPTLHWEEIGCIIESYPKAGFKIITNGLMPIRSYDEHLWKKIDDIIVSLDGSSAEYNLGRRLSAEQVQLIINNIKDLKKINPDVGVGIVIGNKKQLNGLSQNIYDFISMGVNYFALELVTVWEDDKPKYLERHELVIFVEAVLDLIRRTVHRRPKVVHIPRELISGSFYFDKLKGTSCGEGVRAISPRGKIYLCRDHAADEEGLLKKIQQAEYKPVKFLGVTDEKDPLEKFQDDGNNFSQLERYNVLTSCPVKSIQYETYSNPEKLWWLVDGPGTFQETVLQPLWFLTEMNNKLVRDYFSTGKTKQPDANLMNIIDHLKKGIELIEREL